MDAPLSWPVHPGSERLPSGRAVARRAVWAKAGGGVGTSWLANGRIADARHPRTDPAASME